MVAPVTLDAEGAIQIMHSNDYDVLPIVNDDQLEGMWCAPELNDTTSSPSIHSEPQICYLNWKIDTLFNKINRNNPYLVIVDKKQASTQYGVVTWHDATDAIILLHYAARIIVLERAIGAYILRMSHHDFEVQSSIEEARTNNRIRSGIKRPPLSQLDQVNFSDKVEIFLDIAAANIKIYDTDEENIRKLRNIVFHPESEDITFLDRFETKKEWNKLNNYIRSLSNLENAIKEAESRSEEE